MIDRAGEQVRHGREADVRMRAHVDAVAGHAERAAHVIEEHERAEVPAADRGEDALDGEPAEVAVARLDDRGDHAVAGRSHWP